MPKEISFEEQLFELDNIVKNLESGNLSLNESLEQYKKAVTIIKKCNNIIERAEKEVAKISKELDNE